MSNLDWLVVREVISSNDNHLLARRQATYEAQLPLAAHADNHFARVRPPTRIDKYRRLRVNDCGFWNGGQRLVHTDARVDALAHEQLQIGVSDRDPDFECIAPWARQRGIDGRHEAGEGFIRR